MGKAIDISKLQENGRAMHQPAQQITQLLQGISPTETPDREKIVSALREPIQDATRILELGAQYGVPGMPSGFTTAPRSTTTR